MNLIRNTVPKNEFLKEYRKVHGAALCDPSSVESKDEVLLQKAPGATVGEMCLLAESRVDPRVEGAKGGGDPSAGLFLLAGGVATCVLAIKWASPGLGLVGLGLMVAMGVEGYLNRGSAEAYLEDKSTLAAIRRNEGLASRLQNGPGTHAPVG